MQLIFKLPPNKPPFIGIIFDRVREAATLNQDLVNLYKDETYVISMEPLGETMLLILSCGSKNEQKIYRDLKYDLEKTKKFLHLTKASRFFNFSHLIKDYDTEKVVRTLEGNNLFVLKVRGLLFLDAGEN